MHQEIKDRIIQLLEEIVGRAHSINQQSQASAGLEIDLVMEDLRSLYRQFDLLRRQPMPQGGGEEASLPHAEKEKSPKEVEEEPVSDEREVSEMEAMEERVAVRGEEAQEEIPAESEDNQPLKEEAPHAKQELQPEPEPSVREEPEAEKVSTPEPPAQPVKGSIFKPQVEKVSGKRAVVDLFSDQNATPNVGERFAREDNTLHKRIIAQKEDRSIGTRLQMTPVSSLKEAIGVNEKFLFINELFGGNIQVYNESIARLNDFNDMQEAFDYLNELNDLLGWDEHRSAQTIEKLANFVQRRYMER